MESKRSSIKIKMMSISVIGERALIKSTEKLKMILKLLSKVDSIQKIRRKSKLKNKSLLLKSKRNPWRKDGDRMNKKRERKESNYNYLWMTQRRLTIRSIWMMNDSRQFMKTQCIRSIQSIHASIIADQAKFSKK